MIESVSLLPALWWRCPRCIRNNLEIPEVLDVSDEDMIDPYSIIPESSLENDDVLTLATQIRPPESVTCPNCLVEYQVVF